MILFSFRPSTRSLAIHFALLFQILCFYLLPPMTPAGSNLTRKEIAFFYPDPSGVTQPRTNQRRCSTTLCNPAGVWVVIFFRFASKVEPRWDSSTNYFSPRSSCLVKSKKVCKVPATPLFYRYIKKITRIETLERV